MKLIQQKCPKCGAPLEFNENDLLVTCEYCKEKIKIKRSDSKNHEDYILEVENYYKKKYDRDMYSKRAAIVTAILFITVIIPLMRMFYSSSAPAPVQDQPQEVKYVSSLSELDEVSLEKMHNLSLEYLKNQKAESIPQSEWEKIGMYFLAHKEYPSLNQVYNMYKKEYTVDGKVVEGYVATVFSPLEYREGNIHVSLNFEKKLITRRIPKVGTIYGYESNEEFFNKVLRNETNQYVITGTDGLYIEKMSK